MMTFLIGLCTREENIGVTSVARAFGFGNRDKAYLALLRMFHSKGLSLDALTRLWVNLVKVLFKPLIVAGRILLVIDGIKVGKEGRKMPSVKKLHQESNDNTKPNFIWGHSFQAVSFLVKSKVGSVFAIPLASRIHEGLVFTNRDKRTLIDKMIDMYMSIMKMMGVPVMLVADSYYANRKVIKALLQQDSHFISRLRRTSVAWLPAKPGKKKRGRKRKYGAKRILWNCFSRPHLFTEAESPVYGETDISLKYYCVDLLWKPVGMTLRFVLVDHPNRGKMILMSTDITVDPLLIIEIYGYRFKIETSFKQAVNVVGTYDYHFWMQDMEPLERKTGNQHLHKKPEKYRDNVKRKLKAYHLFVQLGCIAQGLMNHLAINYSSDVWTSFPSWLRTMNKDMPPSELVVSMTLRSKLPSFMHSPIDDEWRMFIAEKMKPDQIPAWKMADAG